jgi:hypothetical protein
MPRGGRALLDASGGDTYDKALCDRFFATLECEPLDSRTSRVASANLLMDRR